MMSEEQGFLDAIAADPENKSLRLIYADWLDEKNDPRADMVRDDRLWEWMLPDGAHPIPRLLKAVGGHDPQQRSAARKVLKTLSKKGLPTVREWAREDWENRWWTIRFELDNLPRDDVPSVDELIAKLNRETWEEYWEECWLAAHDLRYHGKDAAKAVPALIAVAELGRHYAFDGSEGDDLREMIYQALGELGSLAVEAAPVLAGDVWWCEEAEEALLKIRPDPEVVYENICCDEDRFARTGVRLVQQLDPTGTGMMIRILKEVSFGRSANAAATVLGEMGSDAADAVPTLIECLQHPVKHELEHYQRGLVAQALEEIGEQPEIVVPVLQEIAKEYKGVGAREGYVTSARDRVRSALKALK